MIKVKLIIQIPCYNEAATLPATIAGLPAALPGVDVVELLVVDDGSTDGTAEVARSLGVKYVVRFPRNQGLAKAFMAGIDASLKLGADVIVNTDADNQYRGDEVVKLIAPILEGKADMVVGHRHGAGVEAFSPSKRLLQRLGSWVVRHASRTEVPDATSGFRAFSRDAALRLNVVTDFTYTLETLILAGNRGLTLAHPLVATNPATRPSRLFRGAGQYVARNASAILRIWAMYEPLRVFGTAGALVALAGFGLGLRFVYYFMLGAGAGKVQSLILAAVLLIAGFQLVLTGLVADLIAGHRRISEDLLYRLKRQELGRPGEASPAPDDAPRSATSPR